MKSLEEIIEIATDPATKLKIADVWDKMPSSHEIHPSPEQIRAYGVKGERWANVHTCVFAGAQAADYYLEVGVRRGHSFLTALTANPNLRAVAADIWSCGVYGGEENTKELFEKTVLELKPESKYWIIVGDSKLTLPNLFAGGNRFDLITIDGDHDPDPAETDLKNAADLLTPGGMLIFDDVVHPGYPGLKAVWERFKEAHPDWKFHYFEWNVGTGIGFKPKP